MLNGIIIGILISLVIATIVFAITMDIFWEEWKAIASSLLTVLICAFVGALIGIQVDKYYYESKIEQYKVAKETIEDSITNHNLSGLERIELVKQATKENKWLAGIKIDVKKPWYFYLDEKKLNDLEKINLNIGENE